MKFIKKGFMTKDEQGNIVLVNEKKEVYRVTEGVAMIWQMSDGKSDDELFKEVSEATELSVEELKDPLTDLLEKLEEVELLSY